MGSTMCCATYMGSPMCSTAAVGGMAVAKGVVVLELLGVVAFIAWSIALH